MDTSINGQAMAQNGFFGKLSSLLEKKPVILQLLRFIAIGLLNTGLSFIIANLVSKYFNVSQGTKLGWSSAVGFFVATIQSYYWNKHWAFGQQNTNLLQNFLRLVWVGLFGFMGLLLVYLGSQFAAPYYYYIALLVIFMAAQLALWHSFHLSDNFGKSNNTFLSFFIVSFIGFLINFVIASKFSEIFHLLKNDDLNKNIALVVATGASMVWNFIGYKLIVFKK